MPEPEPIIFIDTWKIREGKLAAFKDAARPEFGRFMELYEPGGRIDVHGRPADHVLDRMRQMGQQFGVTVDVKERYAGFARLLR